MKDLIRSTVCGAYKYSGALFVHERIERLLGRQFMTILLFHRVTDAIRPDGLTVGTVAFARICQLLARGFNVVPLGEVFRVLRSGSPMPPRTVAVTFDDCYRDNLAAARLLSEHGLPATFFVPTDFVGTDRVFDWDRDLPRMPNLDWADLKEMARLGHEVGSHTASHANLGSINLDQARRELTTSKAAIEDRLERAARWFAYPFGEMHHLRPEFVPLIEETGYEGALSAFGGFVRPGIDDRVLPREAVPYFRSTVHLEMHLSGCLEWLYALKGRSARQCRRPWPYDGLERTARAAVSYAPALKS